MKNQNDCPQEIPDSVKALIAPAKTSFLALVPQARKLGYSERNKIHGLDHIYRVLLLGVETHFPQGESDSTGGDYSPAHPWDAPGMSASDFI